MVKFCTKSWVTFVFKVRLFWYVIEHKASKWSDKEHSADKIRLAYLFCDNSQPQLRDVHLTVSQNHQSRKHNNLNKDSVSTVVTSQYLESDFIATL